MPSKEEEILRRMERLELAMFGDETDPKSTGILPPIVRLKAYLDAACAAFRAGLAAAGTLSAVFGVGKGAGWW